MEAVKQMLFRLQAVEAELERQQKELATPPLFTCGPKIPENSVVADTSGRVCSDDIPSVNAFSVFQLADCEAELLSGTLSPSLQR